MYRYLCVNILEAKSPLLMYEEVNSLSEHLDESVEQYAFEYYLGQGWKGDCCEGASFHFISRIVRKAALKRGVMYHLMWNSEWYKHYSDGLCIKHKLGEFDSAVLAEILDQIDDVFLSSHHASWKKGLLRYKVDYMALPKRSVQYFTLDHLIDIWLLFGREKWLTLCELNVLGFNGSGWPDLTLHKNGEITLVEVKQAADKFTIRQPYWWRNLGRPLGFTTKVLHVAPSIRKSKDIIKGHQN